MAKEKKDKKEKKKGGGLLTGLLIIVLIIVFIAGAIFSIFDAIIQAIRNVLVNLFYNAVDGIINFFVRPIKTTIQAMGSLR